MAYQKDSKKEKTGETKEKKKQYFVSTPKEYEVDGETKTFWTNIGTGFPTAKGGITVELNALPVNGKIYIQEKQEQHG